MIYFCYVLIALLAIRLLIALINYFSFAYLPQATTVSNQPTVSVLIPARNEENTIGGLLEQLSTFDYTPLEIIVYNDHSTDRTEPIVQDWVARNSNMQLINGGELPEGWLGKNHACHQLAKAATGAVLLFLDADVQVKKEVINRSIGHFQKYELHLLSLFPKQLMRSFGEKVSVPLMNWILLSLLPLALIRTSRNKAFSAANGQFMMFNAATYKSLWPHEHFKLHQVEDIAILKLFKQNNLACDTLLGDNDISCRMYTGLDDAVEGFTKNIFEFFGSSQVLAVTFGLLTTIAPFVIYAYMGIAWCTAYILGVLSVRFFVSLASQQSVLQNLLLAFPQHLVFLLIITKGLINKKRKQLLWKGRNIFQD